MGPGNLELQPFHVLLRRRTTSADLIKEGLDETGIEAAEDGQLGSSEPAAGGDTVALRDRPKRSTARAKPTPRDARPAKTTAVPVMIPASRFGETVRGVRGLTIRSQSTIKAISKRDMIATPAAPKAKPRIPIPEPPAATLARHNDAMRPMNNPI
jgi:hypothetical protein